MCVKNLLLSVLVFNLSVNLFAQTATIETTFSPIVGASVSIPVKLTNFGQNVSGYQFTIEFDTASLTYVSTTNINPNSGFLINAFPQGMMTKIVFSCSPSAFFTTPRTIFTLNFIVKKTCPGNISWSNSPTSKDIWDENNAEYSVNWVDGTATMPPVIGTITQPTCSDLTGSVVLNNLPAPGTWTLIRVPNGSSVIGTGTSTTISNLSVGTYSFKYSNGSGCISLPSANVIIVPKTATPTGDTIQFFSTGATVGNLAATGTAIKWYADASGGPALSITKLLDSYSHYYASQTLSGCESTNRLDVMVTVNVPQTIAVSGNVNPGISKCYNATQIINVAGGTTYTVHDGSSATMIAWQNIKYLHGVTVEPGGYMHGSISLSEHCALKASSFISAVPGKDEPSITSSKSFFKLYPNPTNGKFTIEQKSEKEFSSLKFEIFDIFGDRLLIENITGEKKHECRLFDRAQGLYFVKVIADDYSETFKLILTR